MTSLVLIMAIGQALFLAVALASTRLAQRRAANQFLSALMLVFALILGDAWFNNENLAHAYPHAIHLTINLPFLVGPLLYLYFGALLYERRFRMRALAHFAPFVIANTVWMPFYLLSAQEKLERLTATTSIPLAVSLTALCKAIHMLAYLVRCYRLLMQARAQGCAPSVTRGFVPWFYGLCAGLALVLATFVAEHFLGTLPLSSDNLGGLTLSIFVYGIAIMAMCVPAVHQPLPAPVKRYAASAMSMEDKQAHLARLEKAMSEEHLYRQGDLKLEALARTLALTPHELSQIVNECCNTGLPDYLNRWRVEDLKRKLLSKQEVGRSILDLALAAGFNSKGALNRAFKKHTGTTPSEFRRAQGAGTGSES